jgi:ubiquinone/menaquinone biosynthesis C-methylase UbiE
MTPTKDVSTFFHGYATDFNSIYGTKNTLLNRCVNRWFRRSMQRRFEKTLQGCSPVQGSSVLDIGCGPGHFSVALARMGAERVVGLDFAQGMLDLARNNALQHGVSEKCSWLLGDFMGHSFDQQFDFCIVMGFMDYVEYPLPVLRKVAALTKKRAFFSFPLDGGFLAWQRKLRYRNRCPLFMYTEDKIRKLFSDASIESVTLEPISRDMFVTMRCDG